MMTPSQLGLLGKFRCVAQLLRNNSSPTHYGIRFGTEVNLDIPNWSAPTLKSVKPRPA
jgi:hypothetical protein